MLRALSITILAIICISGIVNTATVDKMQESSQKVDKMQGNSKITKAIYERRMQATNALSNQTKPNRSINAWRPLKIYFDLTEFKTGLKKITKDFPKRLAFYEKVFKITAEWWGQALWVRDSRKDASHWIQKNRKYVSKE